MEIIDKPDENFLTSCKFNFTAFSLASSNLGMPGRIECFVVWPSAATLSAFKFMVQVCRSPIRHDAFDDFDMKRRIFLMFLV